MVAYMIAEIEVTDPEAYEEYKELVPQSIAAYGGKYLTRGGAAENTEGDWQPKRIVVTEWESMARAKEWHDSEAYRPARAIRDRAAISRMIVVEGL